MKTENQNNRYSYNDLIYLYPSAEVGHYYCGHYTVRELIELLNDALDRQVIEGLSDYVGMDLKTYELDGELDYNAWENDFEKLTGFKIS